MEELDRVLWGCGYCFWEGNHLVETAGGCVGMYVSLHVCACVSRGEGKEHMPTVVVSQCQFQSIKV